MNAASSVHGRSSAGILGAICLLAGCYGEPELGAGPESGSSTSPSEATETGDADDAATTAVGDDGPDDAGTTTAAAGSGSDGGSDGDTTTSGVDDGATDSGGESSTGEPVVDTSRVVFLLPQVGAAMDLGGMAGADAACQAAADDAGLVGDFLPWLSAIPANAPASRFNLDGGPFVRPDGVVVAEDWADLTDGSIASPILVAADGYEYGPAAMPEVTVITHTHPDGTHAGGIAPCNAFVSMSLVAPDTGDAAATDATWSETNDTYACDNGLSGGPSLYCFQQ
jgi:hypothetical protein